MQPFVSTVTNKLDAKGRVSVPARFREILTAQGSAGFYAFPSITVNALDCAGQRLMDDISARMGGLGLFSDEQDALSEAILGAAQHMMWDAEGRVRIPDELVERAGISDAVAFVGLGQRFRIWAPAALAAYQKDLLERARASRAALGPLKPDGGAA